jgi:hypothetical protein
MTTARKLLQRSFEFAASQGTARLPSKTWVAICWLHSRTVSCRKRPSSEAMIRDRLFRSTGIRLSDPDYRRAIWWAEREKGCRLR